MDYEQKYKEALERAKNVLNCEATDREPGTCIPEYIFPELKESENEKIRKWLIELAKEVNWCEEFTITKEKVLDWLEKQGEQKPTDKVEPKFKVGDILVRKKGKGFLYPVIDMDDKYYVIRAFYKPFAIEKKECEEFFKLVRRRENGKLIE